MSDRREVKRKVVIETTPKLAFEAVTEARELQEWFSDEARTQVRAGGRYEVRWHQGYRAEGEFIELDPSRCAKITWRGTGEPGETTVEFTIEPTDAGVEVTVIHSDFGPGTEWDKALADAERGWAAGLENLKSTLETGVDKRLAHQPFLGINFEPLDSERAAKEGIAVERGIYITGTAEDSGAKAAGLDKGNVIVAIDGAEVSAADELSAALRVHRPGDVVEVDLVRGRERRTVQVTLGQRPQAEVPETAEALAELVAERYKETDAELKAVIEGLTEEEAERCPAEGKWSVKQVLAHLSIVERHTQSYLATVALDGWLDAGASNPTVIPGRLAAALAVTPTLQGLLERFLADEAETAALLRGLPEETVVHRARFRRIAEMMAFMSDHTRRHIVQIRGVVEAVRGD